MLALGNDIHANFIDKVKSLETHKKMETVSNNILCVYFIASPEEKKTEEIEIVI